MLRDAEVEDLPSPMADHEPGMEQPESRGGYDEKVHGGDVVSVIPNERVPSLTLIAVGMPFREVSSDRGNPNEDPELLEFGVNLSSAPAILFREPPNECLHFSRNRGPTRS
jgi:hypothetical protein